MKYDERNYVVCFLAVKYSYILAYERRGDEHGEGTADIIRLIEPEDVLQIRVRSLLLRRIYLSFHAHPPMNVSTQVNASKKAMPTRGLREMIELAIEKRVRASSLFST
jgi:hypothetical protein